MELALGRVCLGPRAPRVPALLGGVILSLLFRVNCAWAGDASEDVVRLSAPTNALEIRDSSIVGLNGNNHVYGIDADQHQRFRQQCKPYWNRVPGLYGKLLGCDTDGAFADRFQLNPNCGLGN